MNVTRADLTDWAAHRRTVVLTVARRVPGADPELAVSRGLERLCAALIDQVDVPDPIAFWTSAALDIAVRLAAGDAGDAGDAQHAASAEAVTAPMRTLDLDLLNSALGRLPAGEQQLLWDHHVGSRPVAELAEEIGVLPYAAGRRLRRAESRLAGSFAETHAETAESVECRTSRAALHDFVRNRLLPHRRRQVEDHMVGCAGCTRAYVDVRESYWMLRAAAPVLLLGAATAATSSTVTAGAAAGAGVGWLTAWGARTVAVVRSALTDPISLTATVASGLLVTTAVTTGVVSGGGIAPVVPETGVVSVSAAPSESSRSAERSVPPPAGPRQVRHTDEARSPGHGTDNVPPGQATKDDVPPGLAKKDGVPPGQATKDGVPPGLAKKDGVPPGQAKKDDIPPGLAKKNGVPPGQAKKDGNGQSS